MEPQTIIDQPIPLLAGGFTPAVGQSTNPVVTDSGAITPQLNVATKFPVANIAQETISSTLDTQRKRIMADYSFEQLGAISIGQFSQGVSGEIDISKDGITAKNINGDTTFAVDGTTGNATFKGTVEAGGFTIVDEFGLHSLENFETKEADYGGNQAFTSATPVDAGNLSLNTTPFSRSKRVLIFANLALFFAATAAGAWIGEAEAKIVVDGVSQGSFYFSASDSMAITNKRFSLSKSILVTLTSGVHTIKVTVQMNGGSNITGNVSLSNLEYLVLGD